MSSKKKELEGDVLFELHGLKVRKGGLYTVQHRRDMDAPSGFVDFGATKLPSDGVGDTFYCTYINQGQGRGVWDTGFYKTDPTYTGKSEKEAEILAESLRDNVLAPYRVAVGRPKAFSPEDQESFEKTAFHVWEGRVYRTDNPVDVLDIYFALKTRHLVTKENAGDATFDNAAYMISDIAKDVKAKDQDATNKFEAIGQFMALLKADKRTLGMLLKYQGLNLAEDMSDEALIGLFNRYVENKANLQSFNHSLKEIESKVGQEKLELFTILKEKTRNPKGMFSKTAGKIYYGDVELGADLKTAAERLAKDTDLTEIKKELLFADENS